MFDKENEIYQQIFRRERLKLVTEWDIKKVEMLEKLTITEIKGINTDDGEEIGLLIKFDCENDESNLQNYYGLDIILFNVPEKYREIRFQKNEAYEIFNWIMEIQAKKYRGR